MMLTLTDTSLQLQNITDDDTAILHEIYASTRENELAQTPWTAEQKKIFTLQQFHAQHKHYQRNYQGAFFWLIKKKKQVIGRLYLHPGYTADEMRIIDITILPQHRNKGFGNSILNDVMNYASSENKRLSIHVEANNPAMSLYKRLGFELKSVTNEVYHLFEWKEKMALEKTYKIPAE